MIYYRELPELDASDLIITTRRYLEKFHSHVLVQPVPFFQVLNLSNFAKYNPSFDKLFNSIGLTPNFVSALVMHFPHTDIHRDPMTFESSCRINIPILNCEHSETRFFEMLPEKTGQTNIPESECVMVDKFTLKCPTILKVGHPHQVMMIEKVYPRISLAVNFRENLSIEWC